MVFSCGFLPIMIFDNFSEVGEAVDFDTISGLNDIHAIEHL